MSLKEVGDGVVKYWAVILFCLGGVCWASVAYADLQGVKAKLEQYGTDRELLIKIAQDVEWLKENK